MNSGYQVTPPTEVLVNGVRCVNVDAETFVGMRDLYRLLKVK